MPATNTVKLEGVRLIFCNFAGKVGPYNREGDRTFGVVIPDEAIALAMLEDGWNIKRLKPSQEETEAGLEFGPYWLQVRVGYGKGKPPKIKMITSRGETLLDDTTVAMLDAVDIANVDLLVNPYHYSIQATGNSGISAYVKTMMVTIDEDELEIKYAKLREAGQTPA